MIQYVFSDKVIPRVQNRFAAMAVLSNEWVQAITTPSYLLSGVSSTVNFKYSEAQEWVNELPHRMEKDRYPFLFINASTVKYRGDVCTIGELVIATLSNEEWGADARERHNINPILRNLKDLVVEAIDVFFATDRPFEPEYEYVYNALRSTDFKDDIDAVVLRNIKLRIIKC